MTGGAPTRPRLVEITGVAGTGKSTLVRLLCGSTGAPFERAEFIHTRDPRHLAELIAAIPAMMPILARDVGRGPRLSWPDRKLIAYVSRWDRLFMRKRRYQSRAVALDQGPVYALVRLRAQGRAVASTDAFLRWWHAALDLWATELSGVVYLDAPDDILLERINARAQAHAMKGLPDAMVMDFLAAYRSRFDEVLERLDRPGGPRVVRFDTGVITPEAMAAEIGASFGATSAVGAAPTRDARD